MKETWGYSRWFWIHLGMIAVAGTIALATWERPAHADETYPVFEGVELDHPFPQSLPQGFAGFDTVPLGHELEALDQLDQDSDSDDPVTPQTATAGGQ
jgi:hypothetical protein